MPVLIPFKEPATGQGPPLELLESISQTGAGTAGAGPKGVPHSRFGDLPDGRPQGSAGVDHPPGRHCASGRRGHSRRRGARGFIKAEIVHFDDLMAAGSMAAAKAAGKVRVEGKDYLMHDGDVVELRFNVRIGAFPFSMAWRSNRV